MHHRASTARPGSFRTGAGGVVRTAGDSPLPPRAQTSSRDVETNGLIARRFQVTRYTKPRHRASRKTRPYAARVWAGMSVVLAAAGVATIVVLPQDTTGPARLDVAQAVATPVTPTTGTSATPALSADTRQLPASVPVRIQIPALGVTSGIMELGLERDGSMEVPPGAYPVGWYTGSPTPGELGPAVLAGHVDWGGEPGAFYGLRELLPGDTVVIGRADGTVATFRVDRVEEHPKDDFPTEKVYGDINHAGLRLITCGGAFDEDTGDYVDNVIVFASLIAAG